MVHFSLKKQFMQQKRNSETPTIVKSEGGDAQSTSTASTTRRRRVVIESDEEAETDSTTKKSVRSDSVSSEEAYEVEKVVDERIEEDGTRSYLMKWKNFGHEDNTWVASGDCNCPKLIEEYESEKRSKRHSKARQSSSTSVSFTGSVVSAGFTPNRSVQTESSKKCLLEKPTPPTYSKKATHIRTMVDSNNDDRTRQSFGANHAPYPQRATTSSFQGTNIGSSSRTYENHPGTISSKTPAVATHLSSKRAPPQVDKDGFFVLSKPRFESTAGMPSILKKRLLDEQQKRLSIDDASLVELHLGRPLRTPTLQPKPSIQAHTLTPQPTRSLYAPGIVVTSGRSASSGDASNSFLGKDIQIAKVRAEESSLVKKKTPDDEGNRKKTAELEDRGKEKAKEQHTIREMEALKLNNHQEKLGKDLSSQRADNYQVAIPLTATNIYIPRTSVITKKVTPEVSPVAVKKKADDCVNYNKNKERMEGQRTNAREAAGEADASKLNKRPENQKKNTSPSGVDHPDASLLTFDDIFDSPTAIFTARVEEPPSIVQKEMLNDDDDRQKSQESKNQREEESFDQRQGHESNAQSTMLEKEATSLDKCQEGGKNTSSQNTEDHQASALLTVNSAFDSQTSVTMDNMSAEGPSIVKKELSDDDENRKMDKELEDRLEEEAFHRQKKKEAKERLAIREKEAAKLDKREEKRRRDASPQRTVSPIRFDILDSSASIVENEAMLPALATISTEPPAPSLPACLLDRGIKIERVEKLFAVGGVMMGLCSFKNCLEMQVICASKIRKSDPMALLRAFEEFGWDPLIQGTN